MAGDNAPGRLQACRPERCEGPPERGSRTLIGSNLSVVEAVRRPLKRRRDRVLRAAAGLVGAGGLVIALLGGTMAVNELTVAAAGDPVIAAAGDIACDPTNSSFNGGQGTSQNCHQLATSRLLAGGLAAVLPLGDNQYYCGGLDAFLASYDHDWGTVKAITHPVVGNHEYLTSGGTGCNSSNQGAAGHFAYYGAAAGAPGAGYYSYDIGTWHLIALNSNCSDAGGCSAASPQGKWLAADLAAHQNVCTLAYWHIPLFSSGGRASSNSKAFWTQLYAAGADVILTGHDHLYERFARQTPNGVADPTAGIREFVVGTGGANHTSVDTIFPNSEVRNATTYGVLKLTLHPGSYDWQFVPEAGATFSDSGSEACVGPAPDTTPPSAPTGLGATALAATRVDLGWSASTDNVGVTAYDVYRNGAFKTSVGGGTTSWTDSTVVAQTTYTYTVRARDLAGNTSPPSNSAVATTPPAGGPPLFSDGFESGGLAAWTTVGGVTVQGAEVYAGTSAARAIANNSASWAWHGLGTALPDLYYRVRFKILTGSANNVYVMKERTSTGTSIIGFYRRNTDGILAYRNDAGAVTAASTTQVSLGAWHELQVHVVINGPNGLVETWLDGVRITALSKTEDLGTAAVGRVQIGDNTGLRTFDVAIDDLAVNQSYIVDGPAPDTTPPSVPGSVTATGISISRIDLDWADSTDDTAVTGYTVYRNGVFLATTGPTSAYSDTTGLSPNTTYSYEIDAFDAAGHHSARSAPPVTGTTLADTTPPNGVTLATVADAYVFESNPGVNFGANLALRADASPKVMRSYLKFDLGTVTGSVARATLRIYANTSHPIGLEAHRGSNVSWTESGITYANAPAYDAAIVGSSGSLTAGAWSTIDVTAAVSGGGVVTIVLTTTSATQASLASREAVNWPRLVVETTP